MAGNKVRFHFNGFRTNCFLIADIPDAKSMSAITFSNAAIGKKCVVGTTQLLIMFSRGVYYSDVTFFDTNGSAIDSCVLLIPADYTDDYKQRNRGYIGDMFPGGSGISRCRPSNIRLLPHCRLPAEYIGDENHYLRVYLFNGNGSCEIVNTKSDEYHVIEEYAKPVVMAETWIGGCSMIDTICVPEVNMMIYHNGLLI